MHPIQPVYKKFKKNIEIPILLRDREIEDADYEACFGAIGDVSGPTVDWRTQEPILEKQGNSSFCVSFSRTNVAETMAKFNNHQIISGQEDNFADLYLGMGSGTNLVGNSLKRVADFAYRTGIPLEKDCPFDQEMLQSPAANWGRMQKRYADVRDNQGIQKFSLGSYSFIATHQPAIKDALQHSPVQLAIALGQEYNYADIIPPPRQILSYHAITSQFIDGNGLYYIFDHYDRKNKKLAANYPIYAAMSFRDLPADWKVKNMLGEALLKRLAGKWIIRTEANGELYYVNGETGKLEYITINVLPEITKKKFAEFLKKSGLFLGINEANFEILNKYTNS